MGSLDIIEKKSRTVWESMGNKQTIYLINFLLNYFATKTEEFQIIKENHQIRSIIKILYIYDNIYIYIALYAICYEFVDV